MNASDCSTSCLPACIPAWPASLLEGEYISVSSQRDAEAADIEAERLEQLKGPEAREWELEELTQAGAAVTGGGGQL